MPDNQKIGTSENVTKAITGIIGLDKDQFCQIAMIAQGEFMKLIKADTDIIQYLSNNVNHKKPGKIK